MHEREIRDVVMRYCRGIDRMDRQLVRSCYHADATDDHGSFSGGVDEFLAWVWPLLERYTLTMHFVGNLLIEVGDDVAAAETYGIAFHRSEDARPQLNLMTGFRYLDRFERHVNADHPPHAVMINCTASYTVAGRFAGLLERRIHVLTPNNTALSLDCASFESWHWLR